MVPRIVRHYGEPFADSSAIPCFYLAEVTRRHVTVALNGDGGDESFAGYTRYVANRLAGRLDCCRLAAPRRGRGRAAPRRGRDHERSRTRPAGSCRGCRSTPAARYGRYVSWFDDKRRARSTPTNSPRRRRVAGRAT